MAEVRLAVRTALTSPDIRAPGEGPVLVACSGGADSLALAAATAFVAPRLGLRAGLVTVDHGLQAGSAERARQVADWAATSGFDPVLVRAVQVAGRPGGPEAAARDARYAALHDAARTTGAGPVLLGHTRDDQAETVLLALARGAGPHGIAGMPPVRVVDGVTLVRPLLALGRDRTRAACAASGLRPWEDPHNTDPGYARARVRAAMTTLTDALGPDLVANLARTAELVAADTRVLDGQAGRALAQVRDPDGSLAVSGLAALPDAVRTRVLHRWARSLGAPGAALGHRHVHALNALVTHWSGQGAVALPGGILVARREGRLAVRE